MKQETLQQKRLAKLSIRGLMVLLSPLCLLLGIFCGFSIVVYTQMCLLSEKLPTLQQGLSWRPAALWMEIPFHHPDAASMPAPASSLEPLVVVPPSLVKAPAAEETTGVMHKMDDDELFRRASTVPVAALKSSSRYTPKIAFLFLTKGPLPLGPLWERFFRENNGSYSIYVHSHPDCVAAEPEDSVFYRRRIPSKIAEWGKSSLVEAERRLLANALLDVTNERFVLLSESCIPLFNFTTVYSYLMNSSLTFIHLIDDPSKAGRGRYNPAMSPTISLSQWRKGTQWFSVNRRVALAVVSDTKYFPAIAEHCHKPCFSDEHLVATLVNVLMPEENANRSVTWADWSNPSPHPARFELRSISMKFLNRVRFGSNCTYNGETTSTCFMFARKFAPNSLKPLLNLSPTLFG